MRARWILSTLLATTTTVLALTSCAPVTHHFRARLWEKCYVSGQKEFHTGNFQAALPLLEEAAKQSKSFEADDERKLITMLTLGDCLLKLGRDGRAKPIFGEALKRSIELAKGGEQRWLVIQGRSYAGLADCQRIEGDLIGATSTYKKAVSALTEAKLDSDHGYDSGGLAMARADNGLADTLILMGKPGEAKAAISHGAQFADWTVALLQLKAEMRDRNESLLWAVGDENGALSSASNPEWAEQIKGAIKANQDGDLTLMREFSDEAQTYLTPASSKATQAVTDRATANAQLYGRNYKRAEDLATEGIEARKQDPIAKYDTVSGDLYQIKALAEEEQRNLQDAENDMQSACDIDSALKSPDSINTAIRLTQLATIKFKLGKAIDAAALIKRATAMADGSGREGKALGAMHFWLARYYECAGDDNKAEALAADALFRLQHRPEHVLLTRTHELFPKARPTELQSDFPTTL